MESSKKVIFIKDWILNYVNSMPVMAQSLVIGISGEDRFICFKYIKCYDRIKNNCFIDANKTKWFTT